MIRVAYSVSIGIDSIECLEEKADARFADCRQAYASTHMLLIPVLVATAVLVVASDSLQ